MWDKPYKERLNYLCEPMTRAFSILEPTLLFSNNMCIDRIMLEIIFLSSFYPSEVDVTFKIIIRSKFNYDLSKSQDDFKNHINFKR